MKVPSMAVLTLLVAELALAGLPGELDVSFGGNGVVRYDFGNGYDEAAAMAQQSDGKLIVAGGTTLGNGFHYLLARYESDGSLDESFGQGGFATSAQVDPDQPTSWARSVAIQTDGRIVAACGAQVRRFLSDGNPDPSFGTDGLVISIVANAVVVQSDGKIVLAGSSGLTMAVARLNPDGTADTTFDGDGIALVPRFDRSDAFSLVIVFGKILVAGETTQTSSNTRAVYLAQLNADGSADASFGIGGSVVTYVGSLASARSIALQTSNTQPLKIVVAGDANNGGPTQKVLLLRYLTSGALDTSFDSDGYVVLYPTSGHDSARAVRIRYTGGIASRIYVAGLAGGANAGESDRMFIAKLTMAGAVDTAFDLDGFRLVGGGATPMGGRALTFQGTNPLCAGVSRSATDPGDVALVRLVAADGSWDSTFPGGGIRLDDVGSGTSDIADLTALPDDGVLALANTWQNGPRIALFRLLADGSHDPSFGTAGTTLIGFGVQEETGTALARSDDGKILVAGWSRSGGVVRGVMARLLPDGGNDTGFDGNGRVILPAKTADLPRDVLLQPDRKVVLISVDPETARAGALRFLENGMPDREFGSFGSTTFLPFGLPGSAALQSEGRIICVGERFVGASGSEFLVRRLLADGAIDPTFSPPLEFGFGANNAGATDVAVLDDDVILVAGWVESELGARALAVVRLLRDGALDTSWGGGDGRIEVFFPDLAANRVELEVETDGSILLASGGLDAFHVVRCHPDGSLDTGYGSGGCASVTTGSLGHPVTALAIDPDGRALVGGSQNQGNTIARLLPGNTTTATRGVFAGRTSLRVFPNPSSGSSVLRFDLPAVVDLDVAVYDLKGRLVRRLDSARRLEAGTNELSWDGRDGALIPVAAGTYLVRARAETQVVTSRITIVR